MLVVVTRWYGGILLGPDRFKHINNCARNILVQEGYTESPVRGQAIHGACQSDWPNCSFAWLGGLEGLAFASYFSEPQELDRIKGRLNLLEHFVTSGKEVISSLVSHNLHPLKTPFRPVLKRWIMWKRGVTQTGLFIVGWRFISVQMRKCCIVMVTEPRWGNLSPSTVYLSSQTKHSHSLTKLNPRSCLL